MPKFFRGVVPAWLSRRSSPARRGPAAAAASVVDRAAHAAVERLEERRLFATTVLTNGTGDGTVSVRVDAYGAYGEFANPAGDAFYDPVDIGGSAGTTLESGVFFNQINNFLAEGDLSGTGNLPAVNFVGTPTANTAVSQFTLGQFAFRLTQQVTSVADEGALLTQQYVVTNNTGSARSVRFVRHVDGDIHYIPGRPDYGFVTADGQRVYEFDTALNPNEVVGYFYITATGGVNNAYTVQPYNGGYFLDIDQNDGIPVIDENEVFGDFDGDRQTDNGYDITISLQTDFQVPAGATFVYTTITRFGQAAPADIVGTPRVQFANVEFTRAENGRFATIRLERLGSNEAQSTVVANVIGGTATPGLDFTDPTPITVVFAPGQSRASFQVPIIDDDILDGDETVLLRLSNPSAGTQLGTQVDATLIILDDTPFIQFAAPTFSVLENVGTAQITVLRTGSTVGEATVDYQVVANGTATADQDFTVVAGELLFANGQREAIISVPIVQDFALEGDETFDIVLSNPTTAGLGSPSVTTITIVNFETPPTVLDVDTIGFNNRITQIVLVFSTDLEPTRAVLHTNYDLFLRKEKPLGGAVSRQRVNIRNARFEYDVNADTVTITPVKGLKFNRFYEINVSGTRTNAISAIGGTTLDGDADANPGDDYRNYFGRGNRLSYYDREGDLVELATENGSVLDIDRPVAREEARVEMQDVFPLETILTGKFAVSRRGLSDNASRIILLNSFGVNRQLPPQIVVEAPDLP